jgi:hypothetical protein
MTEWVGAVGTCVVVGRDAREVQGYNDVVKLCVRPCSPAMILEGAAPCSIVVRPMGEQLVTSKPAFKVSDHWPVE